MQPELTSDLSARQWAWLCDRVGVEVATRAIARATAQGRRPWPVNAARVLRITLPVPAALPPVPTPTTPEAVAQAKARLAELRAQISAGAPR